MEDKSRVVDREIKKEDNHDKNAKSKRYLWSYNLE